MTKHVKLKHGTRQFAKPTASVSLVPAPWAVTPDITAQNWPRALSEGREKALEQIRRDRVPNDLDAMWWLLCDAAKVSAQAYDGPPQTGYPRKSSMPEAGDEVTQWQLISAYLRGEVSELPEEEGEEPIPEAARITRAQAVLDVWHHFALKTAGDKRRLKEALYMRACGQKTRVIRAKTGLTHQQMSVAKRSAMQDMLDVVQKCR